MLYYKIIKSGEKKWIMFLHCICSDSNIFKPQIEELSKYFNILLIDMPGHGNSKEYSKEINMQSLIDDINEILETLKIKKVNIIGLSLGTIIASHFYIKYPSKVEKIAFVSCAFGLPSEFLNNMFYLFNRIKFLIPKYIYFYLFIYLTIPECTNKENRKTMYKNALQM